MGENQALPMTFSATTPRPRGLYTAEGVPATLRLECRAVTPLLGRRDTDSDPNTIRPGVLFSVKEGLREGLNLYRSFYEPLGRTIARLDAMT